MQELPVDHVGYLKVISDIFHHKVVASMLDVNVTLLGTGKTDALYHCGYLIVISDIFNPQGAAP